jgi:hypothetical protein
MRKVPDIKQKEAAGRPMANAGGLKRQRKRLRHQIKSVLRRLSGESE